MTTSKYIASATGHFKEQLFELWDEAIDRILDLLDLCAFNPKMGRVYETEYETDIPPVACRYIIVPDINRLLFYTVNEQKEEITFFHMADMRANPSERFSVL